MYNREKYCIKRVKYKFGKGAYGRRGNEKARKREKSADGGKAPAPIFKNSKPIK